MSERLKYVILCLLSLFAVTDIWAASVHLNVQSGRGRREIAVGDLFYISYEISNTENKPEKPASVPGAKIMYFECTGQSSSMTTINGKMSQSFSYIYTLTLRAQKEGTYSFGPVSVGGVKSNTVNYTIGKASEPQQTPQNSTQGDLGRHDSSEGPKFIGKGDGNLFLRAEVSKTTAYEQEALVYTVKLYTSYDGIKFIGATAAPKFEGFVVEESKDVSNQLSYETYGGKSYATAVIARYIIFPQMKGDLKVLGNTYTVSVDERQYYHDPFWGQMSVSKPLQLNVTPNDLTIKVKELPQPVPANFSGGVGHFTLTSSLPSQTFKSNQAASVIYTVKGTGNLKYVKLPDLNALYPPQLEVYSPTPDIKAEVGRDNVSGSARFDYSFMPLEPGSFSIPSVELVYFDPQSGKYETSVASGYTVNVEKGKGSEKSQTKGKLVFHDNLLPSTPALRQYHRPYVYSFGYWLIYVLPVLLLCAAVVYYRAYIKANSDLLAVKSRKANKMARMRLKKAYACMKKKETDLFYDEMLAALWGYLGDKLKMPTSELNRQNVKDTLMTHGVAEDAVESLITLLDECEFAKYASGNVNMTSVYDKGMNVINLLEDSFKKSNKSEKNEI